MRQGTQSDSGRSRKHTRLVGWALALLWLCLVAFATFVLAIGTALSGGGLFGEVPAPAESRRAAPYWVLTGAVAACGPVGIWVFHHRRVWLLLGFSALGIGAVMAAVTFLRL